MSNKVSYLIGMTKKYGVKGLVVKYMERNNDVIDMSYQDNYQKYLPSDQDIAIQKKAVFDYRPLISIVVPAYNTPKRYMRALIDSCIAQTYENWELILADGSQIELVEEVWQEYDDARIIYHKLEDNGGISVNTNAALELVRGDFIGLLDHDDVLAPNALFEVVSRLDRDPDIDVFYSDEDKIDSSGKLHSRPHFKMDYDQELIRHYNYFCHFLVIRSSLFREVGGLDPKYDGSQDYDLVLRLTEKTHRIYHISKILYHWRVTENSTAGSSLSKDYAYEAGKRALQAYLDRNKISGRAVATKGMSYYGIEYDLPGMSEDQVDKYIDMVDLAIGKYDSVSKIPGDKKYILIYDSSRINRPSDKDIYKMLKRCSIENTSAVGPRFSKDGRLTADGINQADEICRDIFEGMPAIYQGYFCRAVIPQTVEELSPICQLVRRDMVDNDRKILLGSVTLKLK